MVGHVASGTVPSSVLIVHLGSSSAPSWVKKSLAPPNRGGRPATLGFRAWVLALEPYHYGGAADLHTLRVCALDLTLSNMSNGI